VSAYCRVTVTGPQRWADLVLPGAVPTATLMPRIIEVCASDEEGTEPGSWALTTIDGEVVPLDQPLEAAGIYDGDVLLLERATAPRRSKHVDDVRGAVEDRVDETGWIWNSQTTLSFGLLIATIGPLLLSGLMAWSSPSPGYVGVAVGGALFSLGTMLLAARRPLPTVAHILFAVMCVWGGMTAVLMIELLVNTSLPVLVAAGLCGALLLAAVGWALHPTGLPYIAGLSVIALVAGVLVVVSLFTDLVQGARATALTLALCAGILPRVAMVMGGLSGLDYEVGRTGQVDTERFEETHTNSDRLLLGIVMGVGVGGAAVTLLLAYLGRGIPDLLLCALLGSLFIFRSRSFDRIRHVLPLRLAGVTSLGATGFAAAAQYPVFAPWLPLAALIAGVILAALSWVRLNDVPRASLRRILNWSEVFVIAALCVVLAWAMGLFAFVARMSGVS
jgi:type VII secretion integral membrane protein EccD